MNSTETIKKIMNTFISCQISEMKLGDFHQGLFGPLSSSLLLFPQRFGDMSSGLLQVFVKLGNLRRTSNYVLY